MAFKHPQNNAHQQCDIFEGKFETYEELQAVQESNKRCGYVPHPVKHSITSVMGLPTAPKEPKLENTVIILDFNDTLFPTSKFNEISRRSGDGFKSNLTVKDVNDLEVLSCNTHNMLLTYIEQYSKQNICIVTTSGHDYIQNLFKQVMDMDIGMYSYIYDLIFDPMSKDTDRILMYQPNDTDEYLEAIKKECILTQDWDLLTQVGTKWKLDAFVHIFNLKARRSVGNLRKWQNVFVIIGDSLFEYDAAKGLRDYIEAEFGKDGKNEFVVDRIKLSKRPSLLTLEEEHYVLAKLSYHGHHSLLNQGFDLDYLKERSNKLSDLF